MGTVSNVVIELRKELRDVWPEPTAKDCLWFAQTELGELFDAAIRCKELNFADMDYVRNDPRETTIEDVEKEYADLLIMVISFGNSVGIDTDHAILNRCVDLVNKHGRGRKAN